MCSSFEYTSSERSMSFFNVASPAAMGIGWAL